MRQCGHSRCAASGWRHVEDRRRAFRSGRRGREPPLGRRGILEGAARFHLLRNVLTKAPQRLRARLAREVSKVFDAPSKAEARKRMEKLRAGLGRQVPEALACLENGFEAATHFYAFPREHWHRIRSTSGLERLHGEIKRRTRAVGAFPDRASTLRLVTAVALQATAIWADRRYLNMSLLKSKEVAVAKAA